MKVYQEYNGIEVNSHRELQSGLLKTLLFKKEKKDYNLSLSQIIVFFSFDSCIYLSFYYITLFNKGI